MNNFSKEPTAFEDSLKEKNYSDWADKVKSDVINKTLGNMFINEEFIPSVDESQRV